MHEAVFANHVIKFLQLKLLNTAEQFDLVLLFFQFFFNGLLSIAA